MRRDFSLDNFLLEKQFPDRKWKPTPGLLERIKKEGWIFKPNLEGYVRPDDPLAKAPK